MIIEENRCGKFMTEALFYSIFNSVKRLISMDGKANQDKRESARKRGELLANMVLTPPIGNDVERTREKGRDRERFKDDY